MLSSTEGVICVITLINFPSAIGLYWATSSGTSLLQSLLLYNYFQNKTVGKTIYF